jgi:anti-sigma regulatory factor (Ser/Thr protein kinase)
MTLTKTFPTTPAVLATVREFVRTRARQETFAETAEEIALAVTEACANAILHSESHEMTVSIDLRTDAIEIEIRDRGVFRPRVGIPELDGEAHRGFQLMTAMMDEVAIIEGTSVRPGTVVRLVKHKASENASR